MRIVIRCHDPRAARTAQDQLAAAGYEASAMPAPRGLSRPAPEGEDVIVIPVTDSNLDEARAIAAATPSDGRPLAVLVGFPSAEPPPPGLERLDPFTGVIAMDSPPRLLAAQMAAVLRAGVAAEERTRRISTAVSIGAMIPRLSEARMLKALYIGAPSPQFLELERAIARHGGLVAAAFTSFSGFDHLHDEFFDAVVLNGARDPATAIALCAALRRNARLHHLPTMVITAPHDKATASAAIERGATAVTEFNAPCAPSLGWLFEAIRRERWRQAAEHDIRALRDIMGDPRTGLFRRAPFEIHLNKLAEDHHTVGRPLSLSALRVLPAHGARTPPEPIWRKGFNEIANLAGRLVRDTDCAAVCGRDMIIVALPATDALGARRTGERIASVAECTAFASGEDGAAPLIFEQGAVELQPGESGAALLGRALREFEVESVSA